MKVFIMKAKIYLVISLIVLSTVSGCRSINIDKVLIGYDKSKLCTAYNIFYSNKSKILSINYKYGNIIPLGTRIKNLEIKGNVVSFDLASSSSHVSIIYIAKWGKQPIECFIRSLLTNKNQDQLLFGATAKMKTYILKGKPQVGMTKRDVELTWGPPSFHRTPLRANNVWTYWINRVRTVQIIFNNNKVCGINY